MRKGIKKHDTYIGPKSYKIQLLGNLVVNETFFSIHTPFNILSCVWFCIFLSKLYFLVFHIYKIILKIYFSNK